MAKKRFKHHVTMPLVKVSIINVNSKHQIMKDKKTKHHITFYYFLQKLFLRTNLEKKYFFLNLWRHVFRKQWTIRGKFYYQIIFICIKEPIGASIVMFSGTLPVYIWLLPMK